MKIHSRIDVMVFSFAFHAVQPAEAELPTLEISPWFGFFAGEKHSRGMFGVSTRGEIYFNPVENASSAAGISELGMDFQLFRGNKIVLTASPNSAFALKLEKDARIFKRGFAIYWRPDPAKDADGKARMAVTIR